MNWEQDIIEYTDGLINDDNKCFWRRSIDEKEFRISYLTANKEVVVTIPRQITTFGEIDIAHCAGVEVVEWNGRKVGESCSLYFAIGSDFGIGYDQIDLGPRITRVFEIIHDTLDGAQPILEDYAATEKRLQAEWTEASEAGDAVRLMRLRDKFEANELRR